MSNGYFFGALQNLSLGVQECGGAKYSDMNTSDLKPTPVGQAKPGWDGGYASPWPLRLAAGGLLLLLLLAALYWRERVIMIDAAYQVFSVIVRGDLAIQAQRFGAALVQLWPLAAVKAGLSLPWVLGLYSVAFQAYPLIFFGLLYYWARQPRIAVALALYYLLMMTHTFFWIQSELIQGCAAALLTVGLTLKPGWVGKAVAAVLSVAVVYWHPLAVVALLYAWGFFFLRVGGDERRRLSRYLLPAMAIGAMAYKHFLATGNAYDAHAMGMAEGFTDRLFNIFGLAATREFGLHALFVYWFYLPVLAGLSYFYAGRRQWRLLAWLWGATLSWLALILTTYHWGAELFYIESYYLMLGLFIALPLACDWMPQWRSAVVVGFFAALLMVRGGQLVHTFQEYHGRYFRLQQMVEWLRGYPEQRFLLLKQKAPMDKLKMEWASPYETLLLSSLSHPDSALSLYITNDDAPLDEFRRLDRACAAPFGPILYDDLNRTGYFHLRDTAWARILE